MKFGVHEFWRTPHVVDIGDYTWVVEILWQAYFISFKTQWSNGITRYDIILYLVGGLEHGFYDFPYIGNSNPNWLIFIRGVETTSQIWYDMIWYDMIWYEDYGAPFFSIVCHLWAFPQFIRPLGFCLSWHYIKQTDVPLFYIYIYNIIYIIFTMTTAISILYILQKDFPLISIYQYQPLYHHWFPQISYHHFMRIYIYIYMDEW